MKHLISINEWSKNDPIPEITKYNSRIGIVLMGTPGVGKSYFIENYILNKNRSIKVFSTDDVSLTLSKDPNKYHQGSSEINMKRLKMYVKNGGSFVFDTTGTHKENVKDIVELSKDNDYDLIFIHLMGTLDMSLKQNSIRNRNVDTDFLEYSYKSQSQNMKFYSDLKPDKYYVVYNMDGKYRFMRYEDGKLLKRRVDKYVPFKESVSNDDDNLAEDIRNHLIDIIDMGIEVKLKGVGDVEYVSSNDKDISIKQSLDTIKVRRHEFSILIPGTFNFEKFKSIIDVMYTLDTYISRDGWKLDKFIKSNPFSDLTFTYSKENEDIDDGIMTSLDEANIKNILKGFFKNTGLKIDDIEFDDDCIRIYYDMYRDDYSGEGEISSRDVHKLATEVTRLIGSEDYDILNFRGDNVIEIFK